MSRRTWQTPRPSAGFTLVESLISMVLALVVLGAVTMLYLGSSQSSRFQMSIQGMQENGRLAVDVIGRNLRMAAYDNPLNTFEVDQPVIQGTPGASGALLNLPDLKTTADTIGVRFEGGTEIRDCLGAPVATGTYVTNVFGISNDGNLVCGSTTANAMPLVEGIDDMQLRYGLDLDGNGISNRFVEAADVSDWNQVVAMKVALLASTVTNPLTSAETVCMGCTIFSGVSDRKIRAEFQTVIGIRN